MCEVCEEMDRLEDEGPMPTEEPFELGRDISEREFTAFQQATDLGTLKRIRLLQAQVQHHQNMLRAAVESLYGMAAILSESVKPLLVGGMPPWFTASVQDANDNFRELVDSFNYVADRLEQDYTG